MCDNRIKVITAGTVIGKKLYNQDVLVPCGKCYTCSKNRVDAWVFRMEQEQKRNLWSHFITLTYDNANVPISPNGFMTLDKGNGRKKEGQKRRESHFQIFIKELRKAYEGVNIKYYMCAEYGTERMRPHYHVIIYSDIYELKKDFIQTLWKYGNVDWGDLTNNSASYVVGYLDKKKIIPIHNRDDRVPEYSIMSKGIGDNYITKETINWHNAQIDRNYLPKKDGYKIAMPRYYSKQIRSSAQTDILREYIIKTKEEEEQKQITRIGENEYFRQQEQSKLYRNQKKLKKQNKKRDNIKE